MSVEDAVDRASVDISDLQGSRISMVIRNLNSREGETHPDLLIFPASSKIFAVRAEKNTADVEVVRVACAFVDEDRDL